MNITITEVGPRDGLQSEKSFVSTDRKVQLIDAIFASGIRSIEATSFVSPSAVPQVSDAAEVLKAIRRPEGSVVSVLAPNVRGAHGAIRAGADELVALEGSAAARSHRVRLETCAPRILCTTCTRKVTVPASISTRSYARRG